MLRLLQDAFIIAIISFVINISQAKLLAQKNNYSINADQVLCEICSEISNSTNANFKLYKCVCVIVNHVRNCLHMVP